MATTKGGTLILDFKDEDAISTSPETKTQLKKDYYKEIVSCKGKSISIINAVDEDNEVLVNRNDVSFTITIRYASATNEVILYLAYPSNLTIGTLHIYKDNTAYIDF